MATPLMKITIFYIFIFFHLFCFITSKEDQTSQPYVVYMGRSSSSGDELADSSAHFELLSSISPSEEGKSSSIIHSYTHAFSGFSAMLTEKEVSILSGHDEVVSVFPDPILNLHTTRSWDFLQARSGIELPFHKYAHKSQDVIIGVIDTGIWPESRSFNDDGLGEIPSRWKGVCMEGHDFNASHCNRKLIGARYYNSETENVSRSARDDVGHGTHTASTAAGTIVPHASYLGLARGVARGGSPSSRIASYKACSDDSGCPGSALLKAIDDAIKDGVDIISISIGNSATNTVDFLSDPIAIGAFHAEEKGILVICSAGNDGPGRNTVVNTAPWILTVGASSIDREFRSDAILGNGKTLQGSAINLANTTRAYQLVFGETAAAPSTPASDSRNCYPGSLDSKKVEGKIVVCVSDDPNISRGIRRLVVEDAKAAGLILINEEQKGVPMASGTFPFTQVGNSSGLQILKYINSTKNPTAIITRTIQVSKSKPAPVLAYFSSRGPGALTENIIKPDVVAPGVSILGALSPNGVGRRTSYGLRSGTSMACPHVSGAAAFIKSIHHQWTSSVIKSALITTAIATNNIGKPITNEAGNIANAHEIGVGEISPLKALNPGLVFESTTQDYLNFLCFYGESQKAIRSMSSHKKFSCPKNYIKHQHFISNINYPTISIGILRRKRQASVKRVVTNVGSTKASYVASIQAPAGLKVDVIPMKMVFNEGLNKADFRVSFDAKNASEGYNYGAVTWSDGLHSVRVVFAVNVA